MGLLGRCVWVEDLVIGEGVLDPGRERADGERHDLLAGRGGEEEVNELRRQADGLVVA